jgi:hypothetical protein
LIRVPNARRVEKALSLDADAPLHQIDARDLDCERWHRLHAGAARGFADHKSAAFASDARLNLNRIHRIMWLAEIAGFIQAHLIVFAPSSPKRAS